MEEEKKKSNKGLIAAIIAVIAIIVIVIVIVIVVKATSNKPEKLAEEVVTDFIEYLAEPDCESAFELVDWTGFYVISQLDEDDYDDFIDEYEDALDDDDIQDSVDYAIEYFEDYIYDEYDEAIEDEDIEIELVEVTKVKEEADQLYSVKAKVEIDGSKGTYEFYVYVDGKEAYIVEMTEFLNAFDY